MIIFKNNSYNHNNKKIKNNDDNKLKIIVINIGITIISNYNKSNFPICTSYTSPNASTRKSSNNVKKRVDIQRCSQSNLEI